MLWLAHLFHRSIFCNPIERLSSYKVQMSTTKPFQSTPNPCCKWSNLPAEFILFVVQKWDQLDQCPIYQRKWKQQVQVIIIYNNYQKYVLSTADLNERTRYLIDSVTSFPSSIHNSHMLQKVVTSTQPPNILPPVPNVCTNTCLSQETSSRLGAELGDLVM